MSLNTQARLSGHLLRSVICLALAFTACSRIGSAQELDVEKIDRLITATMERNRLVGLSAGVMHQGQVVLVRGYGKRSLQDGQSVTPETIFPIGSVSKQFTCAAIMLLEQNGLLSLQDAVSEYFPEVTRASDITLLDLGQHVSGLPDYYPLDFVVSSMARSIPPDGIIQCYGTKPLDFEPGTRFSYSSTGYVILGRIIEKVNGHPLGGFLQTRIFTPLGMRRTHSGKPAESDIAEGYHAFALGSPLPARPEGEGWAFAAGDVWSTPTDLLTWDLALMEGRVLPRASWGVMITPRRLADGRSTGYGYGQFVKDKGPALVLEHGGSVHGFVATNAMVPATRSAVVLMANLHLGGIWDLRDAIVDRLMPPPPDVPGVAGIPAIEQALVLISELREGTIDRDKLSEEYSAFLTPERLEAARESLRTLGAVKKVELSAHYERGGMEVTRMRLEFSESTAQATMYRSLDGTVQEFMLNR